jgi:two-component system chemotaxis response regulator CheB
MEVLPLLPENLNATVFLVQHMPPGFTASFAKRLNDSCQMPCQEAEAGTIVEPGHIYLGKGGRHLTVYKKSDGTILLRTPSIPKHTFMPSVDVMMASVVRAYAQDTVGVLMTGMGDDGAESMCKIKKAGGTTIAESEESCVVYGMPRAAVEAGCADIVIPAWDIADAIINETGLR